MVLVEAGDLGGSACHPHLSAHDVVLSLGLGLRHQAKYVFSTASDMGCCFAGQDAEVSAALQARRLSSVFPDTPGLPGFECHENIGQDWLRS